MGKEKRLFLLAVMTVMMSTVGYGATHKTFNRVKDKPEEIQKSEQETFKVEGSSDIGYRITTGQGIADKTNVESYAIITVENGTGIKLDLGEKAKGKINVTNKGTVIVSGGIGVDLVTDKNNSNKGATNTFINDGTIEVAGGKGIQLNNEKDVVINNNEIIVDKDTNGIGVSMSAGNFTNSETGTITVGRDGIGIEQSGGTSTNEGTITVSGGTDGIGIKQENGVSTNNGTIDVKSGSGVEITNGTFTNGENGEIKVTAGTGIKSLGGTTTNAGKITVNGGTGVTVRNEFTNRGTITINNEEGKGKGIYLSTGGTVKNDGTITVSGGTGIDQRDGTLNNNGKINVTNGTGVSLVKGTFNNNGSGENGLHVSGSGNVGINQTGGTGNNTGLINVEDGATGIELSNGTFNNGIINDKKELISGKIEVSGIGIKLSSNGKFINNSEIVITKGTGSEVLGGTFTNEKNGVITVTGKDNIGINQSGGTVENLGTINVQNQGTGIVISENGTLNRTAGTINVSGEGSTGIRIEKDINNEIKYNGILNVNSGTGVEVLGGNFKNSDSGKITINQGTGIKISDGTVNNLGNITVNQGVGVSVSGGTFTNEKDIIVNQGEGINVTAGIVENKNKIHIKGDGIGVKVSGTGEFINNKTIIFDKGITGTGIEVSGGKVTNKDTMSLNGGTGAKVSSGEFINEGNMAVANKVAVGIEVLGGKATNENFIKVTGEGTGVKVSGTGEFINNNKIEIGKGTGIEVLGGNVCNAKEIKITNGGTGVKVKESNFINEKDIIVQIGTGVTLENSLFVNSGKITGEGTAIQSVKGNNTVYLKNGSKVTGKIVGADGIDVLGFEKGTYSDLEVNNYEALTVRNGNVEIKNSNIELEYNKGTETYLTEANKNMNKHDKKDENTAVSGNLTMSGSNLIIDFKDSLTNPDGPNGENPIINIGENEKLTFGEGMKIDFSSSDGRDIFNLNEALGLGKDQIVIEGNFDDVFKDTAVWEYDLKEGKIELKKNKYEDVVLKSELKDFAGVFGNQENFADKYKDTLGNLTTELNLLDTKGEFTNVMTQMSGGVHGYIVDFAALNARTLTNTMRNRALTRDYMRKRPLNSWTQDISYIDNNHRLGGLMNVDYTEKGVLGISEKQILPNGRIGLVYGGSKGNAKFEDGANGSSSLDGAYFGGYYNHEFNDKWSLNSNANFVYTHNKVTRNIDITYKDKDKKEIKDPIFKSAYPTYTVGMGTSLVYTVKDDLRNKAHFYAGVDVERIMVGNINENKEQKDDTTGLAVKTNSYGAKTYYSIVPSAGFMVQNTGYVFDRKYRIGADLNWETEVGNIKDGKRIKLTGLDKEYKIETSERENVFSYSLFGALDLTESLSVNARYTSMFSDEYDADMIGAGFEYKMDTMADNFFGTLAHKIENNRPFSDRWGGTFGIMMESDDADDSTSYFGGAASNGDSATSNQYKPKMTLSLNDKQSNWSYYFEAYHKTNDMFGQMKSGERDSHASRYHGEARWNDAYSKGTYGVSFGYRNENSDKPYWATSYGAKERIKRGVHEIRITPSFSYDLGHGFTLGGKSAIVFMYNYDGYREGQLDLNTESQIGITYNGFMPRWSMTMNFYREDTWYDHGNRKQEWANKDNKVTMSETLAVPKRDQVNQLRPSVVYFFGNGASFRFDARIPLGNGTWADNLNGTNGNQAYEVRYGFNYYHPVTPGLTLNVGGTFLNNKTKNKDHSSDKYGNITRGYAFRPNIGFYYSF